MGPSAAMTERLDRWQVRPTEPVRRTPSSELAFGTRDDLAVVLKLPLVPEELRGTALLVHWAGRGAAPVLEHDGAAVLLVRASGVRDLATMSRTGDDETATRALVETALLPLIEA